MSLDRKQFLDRIEAERIRHHELHGSEFDLLLNMNDWIALATHYLSEPVKPSSSRGMERGRLAVTKEEFEDALIKASAVILAALEHSQQLQNRRQIV